jgi:hypothetical protein
MRYMVREVSNMEVFDTYDTEAKKVVTKGTWEEIVPIVQEMNHQDMVRIYQAELEQKRSLEESKSLVLDTSWINAVEVQRPTAEIDVRPSPTRLGLFWLRNEEYFKAAAYLAFWVWVIYALATSDRAWDNAVFFSGDGELGLN